MPLVPLRVLCCSLALLSTPVLAAAPKPAPVIFDTDIGTDIDDAYALAALLDREDLVILGITTVSSDAVARARLAAKLLQLAGSRWSRIPVYAGLSTPTQYMKQVEWAQGFHARNLHESGAVEFMRREIEKRPGEVTVIAVGELTNVAALLESSPDIARKIRGIALMGGSIYRGYAAESKPEPEWNIRSNAEAARKVFESGVPLLVAPLDSTADLKLTADMRVSIFTSGSRLTDALGALDQIWRHTNHWKGDLPTLFDVLAVELVNPRKPFALTRLHLRVTPEGATVPVAGATPNCEVALDVDRDAFMASFVASFLDGP
jgi:purine nucleosidase